jgi:hypothetical protein
MAIASVAQYKSAQKQKLAYMKAGATSVAGVGYIIISSAGAPLAGVIAGTDTISGVVQTNAIAGYPKFNIPFDSPKLTNFEIIGSSTLLQSPAFLYDVLWKAGPYSFNANVTLSGQPDLSARLPNANYFGTELWFSASSTFTGVPTYTITYTNQDGVTGRTAVTSGASGQPINQTRRVSLQEGDYGIQKVESVVGSVATAGAITLQILRPVGFASMLQGSMKKAESIVDNPPVEIYNESALLPIFYASGTTVSSLSANIEVSNG